MFIDRLTDVSFIMENTYVMRMLSVQKNRSDVLSLIASLII